MDATLLTVLLSWTVSLTSYAHPGVASEISYKPRQFFVEVACGGNEKCKAVAWYNNKYTLFLDDRIKGHTDANTRSVVVHELVHYLQDLSGNYKEMTCELHARREHEAYSGHRQYLNKIAGRFDSICMNYPSCKV